MNSHQWKVLIRNFLALVMTLVLFFVSILVVLCTTFTNGAFMEKRMEAAQLSESVYDGLIDIYENVSLTSQVPMERFKKIATIDRVKKDQKGILQGIYQGAAMKFDRDKMYQEFLTDFRVYCQKNGIVIDQETEESLKGLATYSAEEYEKAIQFPFADRLAQIMPKLDKLLYIALAALFVVLLILSVFLVKLYHVGRHSLYNFASLSIGAGGMSVFLSLLLQIAKPFSKLAISPKGYYDLLQACIHGGLLSLLIVGLVLIFAGAVFILSANLISRKKHNLES